ESEPEHGIRHEVQRQLDLVATVGAHCADGRLAFETRDDDRVRMRSALRAAGVPAGRPWIVVHTGATAPSRRYGPREFSSVLRGLRGSGRALDRKSTRLNSSRVKISYAVFCLKKKKTRTRSN